MFKGQDLNSVHKQYESQTYDFLPSKKDLGKAFLQDVPKHILDNAEVMGSLINENVSLTLSFLQLDETLILVHENLQRIAVGVEQMLWDEEDRNGEFLKQFQSTWSRVNNLLCEIHNVMIEKNLTIKTKIERTVMEGKLRQPKDDTARNVRNWIIYREYLNMLEYIEQVFDHLAKNMESV